MPTPELTPGPGTELDTETMVVGKMDAVSALSDQRQFSVEPETTRKGNYNYSLTYFVLSPIFSVRNMLVIQKQTLSQAI